MTVASHPGTDGLTEGKRRAALGRFPIVRPHLEGGVPLASIAQEQNVALRKVSRRAADYRRLGMRGRRLKLNAGKGKRRPLSTIQWLHRRLTRPNLDHMIPTVTEGDCQSPVVGAA